MAVIVLIVGAVAAVAVLAALLFANQRRSSARKEDVAEEVTTITLYHDLRTAAISEGAAIASYYALHNPIYAESFQQARDRAEAALVQLRGSAAATNPQDVGTVDELVAAHDAVASEEEQVLQALERNDVPGAVAIDGTDQP
jgi:CHASE3 domain sensor protein